MPRRRSGGGTRIPPAPPTEGASSWDWLLSVDPEYAMRLSPTAQQRLQQVPLNQEMTTADRARYFGSGDPLGFYHPGTAVDREHIYISPDIDPRLHAYKHETLHAMETLSDYGQKDWWTDLSPAMQQRIKQWYGKETEYWPEEAFVGLSQMADFEPWRIPPEYQQFYSNIYPSYMFNPPEDLPAPPGFYQRYNKPPGAGSRSQREATYAKRAGTGAGQSWGVALPPVIPPQITSTDKSSSSQNKNWSSGGGSKR